MPDSTPGDTGELKILTATDISNEPIPCRYLQLPTLLVQILREYYGQSANRYLPGASHLIYNGQRAVDTVRAAESKFLEIGRLEEDRGDAMTQLPKLMVRRSAVRIASPGIGDSKRMGSLLPQGMSGVMYAAGYTGTNVIFAMSRIMGEADFLAGDTEQLLRHYGPAIRNSLGLQRFSCAQLGDVGKLKEFPGFFAVPIVVDYIYEDNVNIVPNNFPIRSIRLELLT